MGRLKILLVEDLIDFQLTVQRQLHDRAELKIVGTISEGFEAARTFKPDLILLDVNLPDGSGFDLGQRLREHPETKDVVIVFLTARSEIEDRLKGFSLGADDYILKPFDAVEFQARIESKLKLIEMRRTGREIINRGRLQLDCTMSKAFSLKPSGEKTDLDLTPLEFRLLVYFLENEDRVLSREELIKSVWGGDVHVLSRTVDRHVSGLRRKLDDRRERLVALHGVGYRFTLMPEA